MTAVNCVGGLLVRLALLYWAASFAVLLCRLVWPDFQRLAAYGGHGSANLADAEASLSQETPAAKHSVRLTKQDTHAQTWPSFFMAAVRASRLGSVRVTRKRSFTAFYATGFATGGLLFLLQISELARAPNSELALNPACITALPLLLFALHCGVRLVETRCVQRYRPHDTVTLFAAVAGCTFYAMAAVSSAVPAAVPSTAATRWMLHSTYLQSILLVGAVAHLSIQAVQVMVHTILAKLRRSPAAAAVARATTPQDLEEALWRHVANLLSRSAGVSKAAAMSDCNVRKLSLHGAWRSYHFPYQSNPVFRTVLDPHYTCEVLLYTVNTALMVLCVLPHPLLSDITNSEDVPWSFLCTPVLWCSVVASMGVTVFTLANLSITSAEHRRFWNESNAVRREVASVLTSLLSSQPSASSSSSLSSATRATGPLPAELADVAARMLQYDLVEEVLPRWNVIPFVY